MGEVAQIGAVLHMEGSEVLSEATVRERSGSSGKREAGTEALAC